MKRILALLLLTALLSACSQTVTDEAHAVTFYYRFSSEKLAPDTGVMSAESVETDGTESLEALLVQYLSGPVKEGNTSPFPSGTTLIEVATEDTNTVVKLSVQFLELSGIDRSIACACLAETIFGITGCQSVTIQSGENNDLNKFTLTLRSDDIQLTDDTTIPQEG